jgi:hypothetical protein
VQVVRSAARDTLQMVVQLIPLMISKLNETFQMQHSTPEAVERQSELQVRIQEKRSVCLGRVVAFFLGGGLLEAAMCFLAGRPCGVHVRAPQLHRSNNSDLFQELSRPTSLASRRTRVLGWPRTHRLSACERNGKGCAWSR